MKIIENREPVFQPNGLKRLIAIIVAATVSYFFMYYVAGGIYHAMQNFL